MEAELKRLALRGLGQPPPKPRRLDEQTLQYAFDLELAWLAVRYARTPSRVLWDVAEVEASRLEPLNDELVDALVGLEAPWMAAGRTFSVEVKRSDSFPAGPLQIRGAVKNAILEASAMLGKGMVLAPDSPELRFRIEADGQRARLAIDLGGRSLHRRGERTHVSEASLKETLAAQVLLLARWDARHEALVDPMAGAGTLLLEGAASATGRTIWPEGQAPTIHSVPPFDGLSGESPALFPGTSPLLAGIEVHTPAHRALVSNLARADVDCVPLHADFRDVPPDRLAEAWDSALPERGLVVVNPPYGERLERGRGRDPELEELYADLRDWWQDFGADWRIAILGPGRALKAVFGDRPRLDKPMKNGPLSVTLLVYDGSRS